MPRLRTPLKPITADQRAYYLLCEHLDPEQRKELRYKGRFREGKVEILAYRDQNNILLWDRPSLPCLYCISWGTPVDNFYPPILDLALGILLAIRVLPPRLPHRVPPIAHPCGRILRQTTLAELHDYNSILMRRHQGR